MEFFKEETKIDFMGYKKITTVVSIMLSIIALICIITKGLNFGMEFTGGTQVELRFPYPIAINQVRTKLETAGFKDFRVQAYGSTQDILLRFANNQTVEEKAISEKLLAIFKHSKQTLLEKNISKNKQIKNNAVDNSKYPNKIYGDRDTSSGQNNLAVEIRKIEYIGSEVGEELAEQGGLAVLLAILATMVYIALRFEYRFALSAALSLCHDAILVLGIFSYFQVEFDLATLAGILAVLGYSLNDTIVVFDRVRETFRKMRKGTTAEIINLSINQTLSRTIVTSWLTLLVVLALLIYGGKSLFGFSLALCAGIVIGTYSSIYVASTVALLLGLSRIDLLPKVKEKLDSLP